MAGLRLDAVHYRSRITRLGALLAVALVVASMQLPTIAQAQGKQPDEAAPTKESRIRLFTSEDLAGAGIKFSTEKDRFTGTSSRRLTKPIEMKAGRGLLGLPVVYLDLVRTRTDSGDSLFALQIQTLNKEWAFYDGTMNVLIDGDRTLALPTHLVGPQPSKRDVRDRGYVTEVVNIALTHEEMRQLGTAGRVEVRLRGDRLRTEFTFNRDAVAALHLLLDELEHGINEFRGEKGEAPR